MLVQSGGAWLLLFFVLFFVTVSLSPLNVASAQPDAFSAKYSQTPSSFCNEQEMRRFVESVQELDQRRVHIGKTLAQFCRKFRGEALYWLAVSQRLQSSRDGLAPPLIFIEPGFPLSKKPMQRSIELADRDQTSELEKTIVTSIVPLKTKMRSLTEKNASIALARAYARMGAGEKSRDIYRQLTRWYPNDDRVRVESMYLVILQKSLGNSQSFTVPTRSHEFMGPSTPWFVQSKNRFDKLRPAVVDSRSESVARDSSLQKDGAAEAKASLSQSDSRDQTSSVNSSKASLVLSLLSNELDEELRMFGAKVTTGGLWTSMGLLKVRPTAESVPQGSVVDELRVLTVNEPLDVYGLRIGWSSINSLQTAFGKSDFKPFLETSVTRGWQGSIFAGLLTTEGKDIWEGAGILEYSSGQLIYLGIIGEQYASLYRGRELSRSTNHVGQSVSLNARGASFLSLVGEYDSDDTGLQREKYEASLGHEIVGPCTQRSCFWAGVIGKFERLKERSLLTEFDLERRSVGPLMNLYLNLRFNMKLLVQGYVTSDSIQTASGIKVRGREQSARLSWEKMAQDHTWKVFGEWKSHRTVQEQSQVKKVRFIEWILVAFACLVGSPSMKSWLLGSLFVLAGVLFLLWARGFQNQPGSFAHSDQSKVAEAISLPVGPWRYVRHPVILGRTLIMFGVVISAHSIYILTIALVVLGHQYVRMAEAHDQSMAKSLGPLFASYRLLVPSFIPFFVAPKLPILGNISPLNQRNSRATWKRSMLFRQTVLREVTGWFVFGFVVFGVSLFVSWGMWVRVVFGGILLGRTIWVAYQRQVMSPYLKWVR